MTLIGAIATALAIHRENYAATLPDIGTILGSL